MSNARIETAEQEGVVIAAVSGDIDIANIEELGQELRKAGLTSGIGLVIDLGDVRYIDSAGVTMLFAVRQELERARLRVAVAIPDSSPVRRLLKVTAFDEVVPTLPATDDAVSVLRDTLA